MLAPTLDEVLEDLRELAGMEVDPDLTVRELGIDSLALAEWVFTLEQRLNVTVEDERLMNFLDRTVPEIYRELVSGAGLATG
jgi:acyl carrier protein